jgi:hypothetical protein
MNTFERSAPPAPGSKETFYGTNVSAGRTSTNVLPALITNESKRKPLGLPRQSEPPKKKLRTNEGSPDILQANGQRRGSKLTKMKLESVNNSIHDLSSSPTSAPESGRNNSSKDLHADLDERMVVMSPKKLRAPWVTPASSAKYMKTIPLQAEMVMSDEDEEDSFTKNATQQRRHEEANDDKAVGTRRGRRFNGTAKEGTSTSPLSTPQLSSSPSRRVRKLEEIIPDNILRPGPAGRSSPDVIQEDFPVAATDMRTSKRANPALSSIPSNGLPQSRSRKISTDYANHRYVQMFRPRHMLFRGALNVSGYVLKIDKASRTFNIDYDSTYLNEDSIVSNVSVDRIHKVIHGKEGSKVRITTAEIPGIGHEMLLELNSHKLAYDLSKILQTIGKAIDIEVEQDSRLDKIFDNFSTTGQARRKVAGIADKSPAFSPYFTSTNTREGTDLQYESNVDTMVDSSLRVYNGLNDAPEPQERRSATARRQQMLQEDFDERAASAETDRPARVVEGPASRSCSTRISSALRSSPPPPPLKYSQTGKLGEPWENPLAYPSNGKKRATVNFDDLSRLDDDEFLNDNLIAFFLRYLEHYLEQEQPDMSKRSYFFNSYFYEKLRQKPKDKKSIINYEGVKKWTDKISLFNRDFVIVPVNENLHWYLAIICNLSWFKLSETEQDALDEAEIHENSLMAEKDLATENTRDTQQSLQELSLEDRELQGDILVSDLVPESSSKSNGSTKKKGKKRKSEPPLKRVSTHKPAIITLDSLGLTRYPAVSALKHYIAQEAHVRLEKEIDIADIHGLSARKIPIQSNSSDCGLFVCAYLERFVMDPTRFMKQELGRIPQQWPKLHSHDLRGMMRDFIIDLHKAEEGRAPNSAIPSVGEILLPPVTPPRPTANGASTDMEIEDSTLYDQPTSPAVSHGPRLQEDKQREARDQTSGSEEEPVDIRGEHGPRYLADESMIISNGHASGMTPEDAFSASLRARTAKILNSPITRYSDPGFESDSELEVVSPPSGQDHPSAKRMREARRNPKVARNGRSDSASTEFLQGTESYEQANERMPNDSLDDDEVMLL